MVITIERTMLNKHCMIFCHNCEQDTNHILSRTGEFYVCTTKDCHSIVDVEITEMGDETI